MWLEEKSPETSVLLSVKDMVLRCPYDGLPGPKPRKVLVTFLT